MNFIKEISLTSSTFSSGIYIKVLGRIQSYSDRIFCVSLKTEPINDLNEVSFHYLSAIQAYLELTVIKVYSRICCKW